MPANWLTSALVPAHLLLQCWQKCYIQGTNFRFHIYDVSTHSYNVIIVADRGPSWPHNSSPEPIWGTLYVHLWDDVIMVVAGALVPNWRHAISNHYAEANAMIIALRNKNVALEHWAKYVYTRSGDGQVVGFIAVSHLIFSQQQHSMLQGVRGS